MSSTSSERAVEQDFKPVADAIETEYAQAKGRMKDRIEKAKEKALASLR